MEDERPRSRWHPDDGPPPPNGYALMGPTGPPLWPAIVLVGVCALIVVAVVRWF